MKKIFTTLSLFSLFFFSSIAQNNNSQGAPIRKCGSQNVNPDYEQAFQGMLQKHQQFSNNQRVSVVYTIPIIFHVIHTGQAVGTGYNLSLAQINSQITRLNADYRKLNTDFSTYCTQPGLSSLWADCEITFCAAKVDPAGNILAEPGVDRILASSKGWTSPPYTASSSYLENTVKANSSWDPTKYFNVWVTEMGGGILGYAQFPTIPSSTLNPVTDMYGSGGAANTDGVVVNYLNLGASGTANAPYNMGRTLTHESGHWLGLWHIWGDDNGACTGTDYVADTPNQGSENYTCPTTNGAVVTDACSATTPGVLYQNYMDYSDDKCMVMFTAGQKARIQAVMANCVRRASLNTSTVCSTPSSAIGIDESVSNVEMTIFPNPTNGELNVTIDLLNTQDFTISVINTLGQTLKEIKQTQSNGGTVKIDLSSNSAGVYFVTLKSKTVSKTKRIILQ